MTANWPLIGRDEELQFLVRAVLDDAAPGVVVAGSAGVGKTRLVQEALEAAAAARLPTAWVTASSAAASIPFGAFAGLLDQAPEEPASVGTVARLAAAVTARGDGQRLVLAVDDAHLLDEPSAALLHQLVLDRLVTALVTLRSHDPTSDAVQALWKDGRTKRIELQPLSRDETALLVSAALGDPLDRATARELWRVSGGNPMYVRELVAASVATGALQRDPAGLWAAIGSLSTSASLQELVSARLDALSAPASDALESLAVAEELGGAVLVHLHGVDAVDELDRVGLLQRREDLRRRSVRLAYPVYGEVVRQRLAAAGLPAVARRLADELERQGTRRSSDVLPLVRWRLDAGGPLPATLAGQALQRAYEAGDVHLAERLARWVIVNGSRPPHQVDAELLLGQLLHEDGRHAEAENVYADLDPTELTEADQVRWALQRAVNLVFGCGELDVAIALLERIAERVHDPAAAGELTANQAWLLLNVGELRQAGALIDPWRGSGHGEVALMAEVTAAWAMAFHGRMDDALAACDAADRLVTARERPGLNRFRDHPNLPRAFALLAAGHLDAAAALVERCHEQALSQQPTFLRAWWVLLDGLVAIEHGRVATALRVFREGASLQRRLDQAGHLRSQLAGVALAAALGGTPDVAQEALDEITALGETPIHLLDGLVARAVAWTAVASGRTEDAVVELRAAARKAATLELAAFEATLLHDLARLGHAPEVVERLATLTDDGQGRARLQHATALASRDPAALEQAGEALAAGGASLVAAETFHEAADRYASAGKRRRATGCRRRAATLAQACEGASTPGLHREGDVAPLTDREREVTLLAAGGMPSRRIAEQLVVSVRTVDNLLHRAYVKLGVSSRREAAEALGLAGAAGDPPGAERPVRRSAPGGLRPGG